MNLWNVMDLQQLNHKTRDYSLPSTRSYLTAHDTGSNKFQESYQFKHFSISRPRYTSNSVIHQDNALTQLLYAGRQFYKFQRP